MADTTESTVHEGISALKTRLGQHLGYSGRRRVTHGGIEVEGSSKPACGVDTIAAVVE